MGSLGSLERYEVRLDRTLLGPIRVCGKEGEDGDDQRAL